MVYFRICVFFVEGLRFRVIPGKEAGNLLLRLTAPGPPNTVSFATASETDNAE